MTVAQPTTHAGKMRGSVRAMRSAWMGISAFWGDVRMGTIHKLVARTFHLQPWPAWTEIVHLTIPAMTLRENAVPMKTACQGRVFSAPILVNGSRTWAGHPAVKDRKVSEKLYDSLFRH